MLSILVIEDEPELRDSLQDHLEDAGHRVETANDGGAGARRLEAGVVDLVICDVRLPEIDGLTLLRRIRKDSPTTNVILMTGYSEVSQAVAALKEGAYDYLTKPFDVDELLLQVQRIDEVRRLQSELENIRGELSGSGAQTKLVGESPKLRHIH